jgi:hypothetical protein
VTTVVVVFIIAGLFLLGIALLAACSHGRRRPDLAADARLAADKWELRHPGEYVSIGKPPGRLYRLFHRKPWTPFDRHSYVDHPRLKAEGWHTIGYMTDEGIK